MAKIKASVAVAALETAERELATYLAERERIIREVPAVGGERSRALLQASMSFGKARAALDRLLTDGSTYGWIMDIELTDEMADRADAIVDTNV